MSFRAIQSIKPHTNERLLNTLEIQSVNWKTIKLWVRVKRLTHTFDFVTLGSAWEMFTMVLSSDTSTHQERQLDNQSHKYFQLILQTSHQFDLLLW
jgi:hypothetical protein